MEEMVVVLKLAREMERREDIGQESAGGEVWMKKKERGEQSGRREESKVRKKRARRK